MDGYGGMSLISIAEISVWGLGHTDRLQERTHFICMTNYVPRTYCCERLKPLSKL
jgi:hypothetical protein